MSDEQPGVPGHRREAQHRQAQLLRTALGVVELGDRCPVLPHHAQRRMHRVAVLGVLQGDQRPVVRQVPDARRLAVPVDLGGRSPGPYEMDRRPVLIGRPADHRRPVPPDREPRRVRGLEPRGRGLVRRPSAPIAAVERLTHPHPELVAVGVVEPPDRLAVRRQYPVRRAVRPVGDLSLLPGRPVPCVQLVRPRRVGDEQRTVRCVLRPVGQRHPGRPEALLPLRNGVGRQCRNGIGRRASDLSHAPILRRGPDTRPVSSAACGQLPGRPAGRGVARAVPLTACQGVVGAGVGPARSQPGSGRRR